MIHETCLATGLTVPTLSFSTLRKKDATSRNAANPIPSTYGSCAVKTTWYSRDGSNPPFTQICVGSGVPGKGFSALQRAHAQSLLATVRSPLIFPSIVSPVRVTSVAFAVSSVAGLYGNGLLLSTSGCDAGPVALTMRPMTRPVMGDPFACFATGTTT